MKLPSVPATQIAKIMAAKGKAQSTNEFKPPQSTGVPWQMSNVPRSEADNLPGQAKTSLWQAMRGK